MNWKNYPHLFCNGQFKVSTTGGVQEICAIARGYDEYGWHCRDEGPVLLLSDGDVRQIDQCTLIARPIADMSDREMSQMPFIDRIFYSYDEANLLSDLKGYLEVKIEKGNLPLTDALKLSEYGVYFGPQSHFDDGTVIDAATINEATI